MESEVKTDGNKNAVEGIPQIERGKSEEEDENLRFGWKCFQPNCLQKLNGPKGFLVFITFFSSVQGFIVNGINLAVLPTIEKEFGFSSRKTGLIVGCNDISGLLLVTFVSYFGAKRHRPKWIGLGSVLTGIGGLLYCLPKLIIGKYKPPSAAVTKHDICLYNNPFSTKGDCDILGSSKADWSFFVLCMGQIVMGIGTAPLYTLGPAFIDDNVDPKSAPMYFGAWFVTTFIGPGIGFIAGSLSLRLYTDIKQPPGFSMTPDDIRWIGAWWFNYFAFSWTLLIVGFILVGYPKKLPGAGARRQEAIARGELKGTEHVAGQGLKSMFLSTIKLLKNKTLVFMIFGLTVRSIWASGFGPFLVKFVVLRYGAKQVVAGIAVGILILPCTAVGVMGGSYVMKKFSLKDSTLKAIKFCVAVSAMTIIFVVMFFIPGCKDTNLAGIRVQHPVRSGSLGNLNFSCNANCNCRRDKYSPACGSDGFTYFSSCHAGCKDKVNSKLYTNCSCIAPGNDNSTRATPGRCDKDCKNFGGYLVVIAILLVVMFSAGTPHSIGLMRVVAENEKSYALGLQFLVVRTLSFAPAPALVGLMIDNSCFLWKNDFCGNRGECLEYHVHDVTAHIVILGVSCSGVSALLYLLAWYFYVPMDDEKKSIDAKLNPTKEKYVMDRQSSQMGMINNAVSEYESTDDVNN